MDTLLFAFWFFLPAGIANMSPVLLNKLLGYNRWDSPMDFGKSFRRKRIFGDNKKWRGLVGGVLLGATAGAIIYPRLNLSLDVSPALLGGLLGFGALYGDAVESFFKRQSHRKPGDSWFPFDQIDYILGGIVASLAAIRLNLSDYLLILAIYFGLHLIVSYIGYLLKLKSRPI